MPSIGPWQVRQLKTRRVPAISTRWSGGVPYDLPQVGAAVDIACGQGGAARPERHRENASYRDLTFRSLDGRGGYLMGGYARTGIWGPDRQAARSSGSTEYDRWRSRACPARGQWLCGRAVRVWRVVPLIPLWLSLGTQARPRRLEVGEPGARVDAEFTS
jgi:hypothetical protein